MLFETFIKKKIILKKKKININYVNTYLYRLVLENKYKSKKKI